MKILKNAIRCNHCGTIIESLYRHDYRRCPCGRVAVDGGLSILRRAFIEDGDYTELSEYSREVEEDVEIVC